MNRELELVRILEPEIAPADEVAQTRQRARLIEMINDEALSRPPVRRRRRSMGLRVLAATVVLSALGGGAAFAWSKAVTPDARHAAQVERQNATARAGHIAGWRPELDAEHVVCDYRGTGRTPTLIYTYASGFPLTAPLTEARLVDECRAATDAVRTAPIASPGLLCAVTPPRERFAVPAVSFGFATCNAASLAPAPATLLDERNRLRRDETAIRAVGDDCPTAAVATAWVREQVAATGAHLRILPTEAYAGGRCYLPHVAWGRGEVEVTAQISEPVPGVPDTTPPPTP